MKNITLLALLTLTWHINQHATQSLINQSTLAHLSTKELYSTGMKAHNQNNLHLAQTYLLAAEKKAPVTTVWRALGLNERRIGNLEASIYWLEKAYQKDSSKREYAFSLALSYLTHGDIRKGWQLFNQHRSKKTQEKMPKTLNDVKHKRILIKAEWGLGDMIHFVRYAKQLKGAGAIVLVQTAQPLLHLMKTCPYIDDVVLMGRPLLPAPDFEIPFLCLPTFFNTTETTIPAPIPYLVADDELVNLWHNKLKDEPRLKIALCWDVGHKDTDLIGWKRSLTFASLKQLLETPYVHFYSLQKDPSISLEQTDSFTFFTHHFDTDHGGFMDSAALMKNTDLVITVDTAIAHLAGALNVPTWLLLPYNCDYRWTMHGDTTPWYPSMRLFRQTQPGDWQTVISTVQEALKNMIA